MDKNKPLITIITLNYNSSFLKETIDSVLKQTYPNIEYILIDDGSNNFNKEKFVSYINKNKKNNIKKYVVIANENNIGTVKEYNRAIKLSSGEIIFNLSSDDIFNDKYTIENWVNHFIVTKTDISTGIRENYDETMTKLIERMPRKHDIKAIQNLTNKEFFKYSEGQNVVLGCCTARTKKCAKTICPINEEYRLIEDYPFLMQSLRKGFKLSFFNNVVIKCRMIGVSSTINLNQTYLNENDLIFKNEILPYSDNKRLAMKKYNTWKKNAIIGKKYKLIFKELNEGKINKFSAIEKLISLIILNPIVMFKKIYRKMLK